MCTFWGYIFYKVWIYNNDFIKIQKAVYKMFTAKKKTDINLSTIVSIPICTVVTATKDMQFCTGCLKWNISILKGMYFLSL